MLLEPLEGVKQSQKYHPEGDALYHSLQVFELAREERPYDEEFLLAALLHDVGKAIDPSDHVEAALQALEGSITERTAWLIAHHMEAQALRAGTLGTRARVAAPGVRALRRPDAPAPSSTAAAASPARPSASWTRCSITSGARRGRECLSLPHSHIAVRRFSECESRVRCRGEVSRPRHAGDGRSPRSDRTGSGPPGRPTVTPAARSEDPRRTADRNEA